jgi:hypothetical protein
MHDTMQPRQQNNDDTTTSTSRRAAENLNGKKQMGRRKKSCLFGSLGSRPHLFKVVRGAISLSSPPPPMYARQTSLLIAAGTRSALRARARTTREHYQFVVVLFEFLRSPARPSVIFARESPCWQIHHVGSCGFR